MKKLIYLSIIYLMVCGISSMTYADAINLECEIENQEDNLVSLNCLTEDQIDAPRKRPETHCGTNGDTVFPYACNDKFVAKCRENGGEYQCLDTLPLPGCTHGVCKGATF